MRRPIASTFVLLDGILQAPGGPEEEPTDGFASGAAALALAGLGQRCRHERLRAGRRDRACDLRERSRRHALPSSRRRLVGLVLALVGLGAAGGLQATEGPGVEPRPESWAQPMGEHPGLSNFFQVSDELYRGAQPRDEGFEPLKTLGVRTVVELRSFHSDREACRRTGLRHVHIPMQAWEAKDEDLVAFLKAVTDPAHQPVFVHCRHGADRTGVAVAVYRIAVQGWSKDEAIREMTEGGFGFHAVWHELVDYVREVDVARLRELAGLPSSGGAEPESKELENRVTPPMAATPSGGSGFSSATVRPPARLTPRRSVDFPSSRTPVGR